MTIDANLSGHSMLPPSTWVIRFGMQIDAGGKVLDVACGGGRHACWFAARGHPVTAVDRDLLPEPAPGVEFLQADLESGKWPFTGESFAAVVVTNYLHRPLFPELLRAVASGGWLIYETFAAGNEKFGRPARPEFLLQPGELLEIVRGQLQVIAYEDSFIDLPKPAMVQRIAARRPRP